MSEKTYMRVFVAGSHLRRAIFKVVAKNTIIVSKCGIKAAALLG